MYDVQFNYALLLLSFALRVYSWSLMAGARTEIAAVPRFAHMPPFLFSNVSMLQDTGPAGSSMDLDDAPFRDKHYVNMFQIGASFGVSFYINAFSAILTWMKLFKFLSIFPQMSIFTSTLALSAQNLGVFLVVVVVVVVGSASGFCLAFGTDVDGFRNPFQSVVSLALFTVGHFNYEELVKSQRWLGPMLFWMYIFLVFFVLMSVFIAILAEGVTTPW
jgi:hypothetical protein